MSVRLNKSQIDKVTDCSGKAQYSHHIFFNQAAKDKSGKFSENFNVTLFLVRPNDQTLQAEFSRSNLICQVTALIQCNTYTHTMPNWDIILTGTFFESRHYGAWKSEGLL